MAAAHESINVRLAGASDAVPLSKLGRQVFTSAFGHSVSSQQLETYLEEAYTPEALTGDIVNPDKDMVIVTCQSKKADEKEEATAILGFALLTRGTTDPCIAQFPDTVELQRIYVHPSRHGNGIGRILSTKVEDIARKEGFKYMWLGVWQENHKAHRVYAKFGYKAVGEHDFDVGGNIQRDLIMIKEL